MSKLKTILISNDDGVFAPGLEILAEKLQQIANVYVIAPDRNRSAASHSLTIDQPLRVKQLSNGFYSVDGTPTDCVHLGTTGFLSESPDMVVAGINAGANLGDDVIYSGTVAAATEGRFLGYPAIAVALVGEKHYETAAEMACRIVSNLDSSLARSQIIWNVNVPDIPLSEVKGIEVTRLGSRHCAEPVVKSKDPRGREIYWVGPAGAQQDAGQGTDFAAINKNKVSLTPLQIDLTDFQTLPEVKQWVNKTVL